LAFDSRDANEKGPEQKYDRINAELKRRVTVIWEQLHEELYPRKSCIRRHVQPWLATEPFDSRDAN
jgi:hypothetical protein